MIFCEIEMVCPIIFIRLSLRGCIDPQLVPTKNGVGMRFFTCCSYEVVVLSKSQIIQISGYT